MNITISS